MKVLELVEDARQSHGIRHSDYSRYRKYCSKRKGDLFLAERAYYYSVQLLEESEADYRKHIHSNKRLKKATKIADELVKRVDKNDQVGVLETMAYSAVLKGRYSMQMHIYSDALELFALAKKHYEDLYLIAYSDQHKILIQKASEDLMPLVRYCNYSIDPSCINELLDLQDMDQLAGHIKHLELDSRVFEWTSNFTAQGLLLEKLVKLENERAHKDFDKLLGTAWEATSLVEKMLKDHAEATKSVESSMSKVANDNLQRAHDYIIFWRVVWTIERNIGLIDKCKTEKEMIEDIKLSKVILKSAEQLNVMYEPQEQFKQGVEQYARSLSKLCFANLHLYRKNYNAALHFARTAREIMPAYEGEFDHVLKEWEIELGKRIDEAKAIGIGFTILESNSNETSTPGSMILNSREFRHLVNPTIADRNLLPIPYRPIFYDLAYNYLEFPIDNIKRLAAGKPRIPQGQEIPEEEKQQEKKGWFSFLQ